VLVIISRFVITNRLGLARQFLNALGPSTQLAAFDVRQHAAGRDALRGFEYIEDCNL
jgi:hypothetical protein